MRSPVWAVVLCSWLVWSPALVQAGPLKDIEDSGRSKPRRDDGGAGRSYDSSGPAGDDDDQHDHDGRFALYVLTLPWSLPHMLMDQRCASRYAPYPYAAGRGNLRSDASREDCAEAGPSGQSRAIAAQVALEGGYALAYSDVTQATLSARLQLPYRLELSGRLSVLTDLDAEPREQALMGTSQLSVRFAQAPHVELRSGLGLRAYGMHQPLFGVDFVYAIDVYGKRPLFANMEFHGGSLGEAGVLEGRITLGYLLKSLELYVGYDHTRIRGSAGTTRLSGPVAGLRAWF